MISLGQETKNQEVKSSSVFVTTENNVISRRETHEAENELHLGTGRFASSEHENQGFEMES